MGEGERGADRSVRGGDVPPLPTSPSRVTPEASRQPDPARGSIGRLRPGELEFRSGVCVQGSERGPPQGVSGKAKGGRGTTGHTNRHPKKSVEVHADGCIFRSAGAHQAPN